MTESIEEMDQLAGEYVLGTLDPVRRTQVAARLPRDAALRQAVAQWERRLLPLTALAAPQQPSAGLWPRVAASLAASVAPHRLAAAERGQGWRRWWDSLNFWRSLAGGGFAAAALCAVLLAGRLGAPDPSVAPGYMVVLVAPQDRAPGWVVQASLNRQLTLTPLGQTAVPQQRALQFWTKGAAWNGPVSLGLVQPGRSRQMTLERLPPLETNQLFEITLEPEHGSPTGKPSGPVLYIGKAVKVM